MRAVNIRTIIHKTKTAPVFVARNVAAPVFDAPENGSRNAVVQYAFVCVDKVATWRGGAVHCRPRWCANVERLILSTPSARNVRLEWVQWVLAALALYFGWFTSRSLRIDVSDDFDIPLCGVVAAVAESNLVFWTATTAVTTILVVWFDMRRIRKCIIAIAITLRKHLQHSCYACRRTHHMCECAYG